MSAGVQGLPKVGRCGLSISTCIVQLEPYVLMELGLPLALLWSPEKGREREKVKEKESLELWWSQVLVTALERV